MARITTTPHRVCHHCKTTPMGKSARVCESCKAIPVKRVRTSAETKAFHSAYYLENRDSLRVKQKDWRDSSHGQRARFSRILRNYGITAFEWAMHWRDQDGKCAGCLDVLDMGKNTHVDHCHSSGVVRGLLCHNCNLAIGKLGDCAETLNRLAGYLIRSKEMGGDRG